MVLSIATTISVVLIIVLIIVISTRCFWFNRAALDFFRRQSDSVGRPEQKCSLADKRGGAGCLHAKLKTGGRVLPSGFLERPVSTNCAGHLLNRTNPSRSATYDACNQGRTHTH